MAKSASVDPLRLGNFQLGVDSIICKYDESKADKEAKRLSKKNIYANPNTMLECQWTALGVWIALKGEQGF